MKKVPSTVYKGDLTEISFGRESGITLPSDYDYPNVPGAGDRFHFIVSAESESNDTSTIKLQKGKDNTPVEAGILAYPLGMLVGSELIFSGLSASQNFSVEDNFNQSGRRYTIVSDTRGADYTELVITPKMISALTDSPTTVNSTNGTIHIMPFCTPSLDIESTWHANANASSESVLTDQFAGLINTLSLPETKVDLKRMHVIGLGRDVAIQVPGRFTNTGGQFETSMHNARWLYYALGLESVKIGTSIQNASTYDLKGATAAGANMIIYDGSNTAPTLAGGAIVTAGDYVFIKDAEVIPLHLHKDVGSSPEVFGVSSVGPEDIVTQTQKNEIRRIVAIHHNTATTDSYIWLDGPLDFAHADGTDIGFLAHDSTSTGSPEMSTATDTYGTLTNPVNRVLFSQTHIPSFAFEVSIRRNDNQDDDGTTSEVISGGSTDAKQLTRVFRGCKVKDFSMVADTDAAVRLNVGFDAAICYTDTGRLETNNKGDRFDVHRVFEDVANTEIARKKAGIAKRTQKPFMFYNGTIELGGITLGQVVSFDLKGKTGVKQFYTISGNKIADLATDQVPFGGARNASLSVEGKTEYELDMEIIIDDPTLYHQMRRAVESFDDVNKLVRLSFTKQGAGAASGRESMDIVMDDYYIVEAPLPIPEDKGPLRSKLKIMPKALRVFAQDTVFHY